MRAWNADRARPSELLTAKKLAPGEPMQHDSTETKDWSQLFANYRGQWVALADDEVTVLAAALTATEALAASASKGTPAPILYRVPDNLDTFVGYEICL
jgi:hypothetical protein